MVGGIVMAVVFTLSGLLMAVAQLCVTFGNS